jgi:hypothetical protein
VNKYVTSDTVIGLNSRLNLTLARTKEGNNDMHGCKQKTKTARLIGWYGKWKEAKLRMKGEKKPKSEVKNKEGNTEWKCNKHKTKRGEA